MSDLSHSPAGAEVAECPVCGGTGWKTIERDGLTAAQRCACQQVGRTDRMEAKARIPPLYAKASFDNFFLPSDNPMSRKSLSDVSLEVRNYAMRSTPFDAKPGLLLIGDPGTGKTHLAVAALRRIMQRGFEGLFYDYQSLFDDIRAGYDKTAGTSNKEAYRAALEAEYLLLDDLGAHRVTEWAEDTITAIITHRCNHRKPLIATTNLPDQDVTGRVVDNMAGSTPIYKKTLAEIIGPRARSRLFEMCHVVRMPAVEDYRLRRSKP
ncbi:MAG: ATP-binding protein [Bryobacteraceae bacterium]